MSRFDQWVAELPQQVREHLASVGLTSAQRVVDSVQPEYLRQPDGNIITITVDAVFLNTITDACDQVKKGGGNFAMVREFYDRCFQEVAAATGSADPPEVEATPIEAKDAQCEEYYELQPEYRRRRLAELDQARRCEVDDSRRPSQRMWGRWERYKRVHKEFEPVPPNKVQSEAAARHAPAAAMLMPSTGGALAWKLPPMEAKPADSLLELEDHCFIIENLLFLVGYVKDITCLDTFHSRFWTRVRHNRNAGPGFRAPSVGELAQAYMVFQKQWARASRTEHTLDNTIFNALPAAADELDARLALAPRLATLPALAALPPMGARAGEQLEPPLKLRRLSRAQRRGRAAARAGANDVDAATTGLPQPLAALQDTPSAAAPSGPPAKGKGKAKGRGKGGKAEAERRARVGEWCRDFLAGKCTRGDECWFRHK